MRGSSGVVLELFEALATLGHGTALAHDTASRTILNTSGDLLFQSRRKRSSSHLWVVIFRDGNWLATSTVFAHFQNQRLISSNVRTIFEKWLRVTVHVSCTHEEIQTTLQLLIYVQNENENIGMP